MKNLIYMARRASVALAICTLFVGCKPNDDIPEEELINIFHDAFLANAYLSRQGVSVDDSLLIYEPILQKYGYTIDEFREAIMTLSQRKSARISQLITKASERLDAEAATERRRIMILDTIDNVAKRTYTRTLYSDSLLHVKRLKDTTKLRISIKDIIPGEYQVSFNYFIDTLDENRNSRVEAYLLRDDTLQVKRHTQMLSRYKEGKYNRTFTVDTIMQELYINMYYHPRNEESKLPNIKITNLKVVRILPKQQSLDSLYLEQFDLRLFDIEGITRFVADTIPPIIEVDSLHRADTLFKADSLLGNRQCDSLAIEQPQDSIEHHESQDSLTLRARWWKTL
jgi:hypothetical protein